MSFHSCPLRPPSKDTLCPPQPEPLAVRIVFSHYKHPLHAHGRVIGKCLQLFMVEAQRLVHSFAMLRFKDILPCIRYWNERIRERQATGTLRDPKVELFELDVKAMFPSLSRDGVRNAVQELHTAIMGARRQRHIGRGRMLKFAINTLDRKVDRLGHGHSDLYHNVNFDEVRRFCILIYMRTIYWSLLIQFSV